MTKWRSGQAVLDQARSMGKWPDGKPIGKGHGSPYLQAVYAEKIGKLEKKVEGRAGGGWVDPVKTDDWINFKVPKHPGENLIVRVRKVQRTKDIEAMVRLASVESLLPGSNLSVAQAVALYRTFGNSRGSFAEIELTHGAVAIHIEPLEPSVDCNPCVDDDGAVAKHMQRELNGLRKL